MSAEYETDDLVPVGVLWRDRENEAYALEAEDGAS